QQGRALEQHDAGHTHARFHALGVSSRPDRRRRAPGRPHAGLHRLHSRRAARPGVKRVMDDLKFYLFLGVQGLAFLVLLVFVVGWPGPWNGPRLAGSLFLLVGISLIFTARLQLGKSFSLTPQARKLVTHGLYSRIRNPIYV